MIVRQSTLVDGQVVADETHADSARIVYRRDGSPRDIRPALAVLLRVAGLMGRKAPGAKLG